MTIRHHAVNIDGLDIFYREAGDPANPTLVLLHGFPTSSSTYKALMAELSDGFHLIAPDFPGFGHSSAPPVEEWKYTFDNLAAVTGQLLDLIGVRKYAVYIHDYGAPVAFRLALADPKRITGIITQSGNAYEDGLTDFWGAAERFWADPDEANSGPIRDMVTFDAVEWQYRHGVPDPSLVDPDAIVADHAQLSRPGNADIQLALFLDYATNVAAYPAWQQYLRVHQPPVLAVWGRHDEIFGPDGARAFARDVPDAEIQLLDAGHFALQTRLDQIAALCRRFLERLSD